MQKSFIQSLLGLTLVCSLLYSCDGGGGQQFATKEDSLSFAQSVMEKYPAESAPKLGAGLQDTTGPATGRTFQQAGPEAGVQPIDWPTVLLYQANYDKNPQIKSPKGYFYQGFSVDSSAWQKIINTPSIKGMYLRLGKKPDGSYTIMLLGLDSKGNVMGGNKANKADGGPNDDTNWDNSIGCPENCPMEPGN